MKLVLNDYAEGVPTDVGCAYDAGKLDLDFVDLRYPEPIRMSGVVRRDADAVSFKGALVTRVIRICGRCLKETGYAVEVPFELYYDSRDRREIDTLDDLRESLILEHPISYLCKEDCRGLCPQCGADLNHESCKCFERDHSGPFAALKNIMPHQKEGS